jgi:hypothetical protein
MCQNPPRQGSGVLTTASIQNGEGERSTGGEEQCACTGVYGAMGALVRCIIQMRRYYDH